MLPHVSATVTQLLLGWRAGNSDCLKQLIPLVESELRQIAHRYMRGERRGHTLQTTALVNEAYLKLIEQADVDWQSRAHFFGVAANVMRHILVDHARALYRGKRAGGIELLPLNEYMFFSHRRSATLVALDDALVELTKLNPRKARVVELRFFGGLTVEETAEVIGVHPNTVIRDWEMARRWLRREIGQTS